MIGSLGVPELLIIFVIVMLLFGVGKLPRLGQGLGEGIRNFKQGIRDINAGSPQEPDDPVK